LAYEDVDEIEVIAEIAQNDETLKEAEAEKKQLMKS